MTQWLQVKVAHQSRRNSVKISEKVDGNELFTEF